MGELLEFPSPRVQGLAFLDRRIRQLLSDRGADDELMDFAAGELTRIYSRIHDSEQYCFAVDLPDSLSPQDHIALRLAIETGLEGVRRENHALVLELVAELVLARVQLFQSRRG
ncbi:hypothetical protein [Haliea sp. E17]|uniref:hypothetical protein n=1 Tax=Haliea sp. E17 TaxID=3401576 RepID=UPI003AADF22F